MRQPSPQFLLFLLLMMLGACQWGGEVTSSQDNQSQIPTTVTASATPQFRPSPTPNATPTPTPGGTSGGENFYIRPDATGTGDGSDWTNAYVQIPESLVRGAIYYLADGVYPTVSFQDALQGELTITIKKATESDHGTSTGWDPDFGDGVAVFRNMVMTFRSSYYVIDGAYGEGHEPRGIKIHNDSEYRSGLGYIYLENYTGAITNLTFRHVEVDGTSSNPPGFPDNRVGEMGFYGASNLVSASDITLSHVYFHDFTAAPATFANFTNLTMEYSVMARNRSTPEYHSSGIGVIGGGNFIFRYNIFEDLEGTGVITSYGDSSNWQVYGNVFLGTSSNPNYGGVGHGVVADNFGTTAIRGLKFYNNTIVGINGINSGVRLFSTHSSNAVIVNNLWVNNSGQASLLGGNEDPDHHHNSFINTPIIFLPLDPTEEQTNSGSPNPLVDVNAYDFRLRGATNPGASLPTLYQLDPLAIVRGADGTWDRGAFEWH